MKDEELELGVVAKVEIENDTISYGVAEEG